MPMPEIQKWVLYITPQTHVRSTYNENWMPPKSDAELLVYGRKVRMIKTAEQKANPKKKIKIPSENKWVNRKWEIKRYWDYKDALRFEAARQKFEIPTKEFWVKFYIPMSPSWSRKKKATMCFACHEYKPDSDNLIKAMFDALRKKDQVISDYRASKFWIDSGGHIEISVGELPEAVGYTKIKYEEKIK